MIATESRQRGPHRRVAWLCAVLVAAACSRGGDSPQPQLPPAHARSPRSGVDTLTVVARPSVDTSPIILAPCTTTAKDGEPAALSDPYQYVQSGGAFVHTSILLVQFARRASPAARARVLRGIRGCVVGQDGDWTYVRIPTDTTALRQYELADSLSKTSTVDFATPQSLWDAECAMEGPRDRCTDEARRMQLQEWRRSFRP